MSSHQNLFYQLERHGVRGVKFFTFFLDTVSRQLFYVILVKTFHESEEGPCIVSYLQLIITNNSKYFRVIYREVKEWTHEHINSLYISHFIYL